MTHPYSIFIWQAPLGKDGEGRWEEPVQVSYEAYALYLAALIHISPHGDKSGALRPDLSRRASRGKV